jgi:UDP-N-acetylglucosamine--N-acetylmuramyl-(pentapeptide) pyrophosphoryl-undecaprenol N-acetylglucosamine transferase
MKLERLLITCGGTGGHFYPGLAIAKAIQKRGGKVKLLLSGKHAPTQKAAAEKQGVEAIVLPALRPLRQAPFSFTAGVFKGFCICRREIKSFAPQALIGMGSFTSSPAVLAAKTARVPLYLHDGNAKIGKANRFFSRAARFLATAFPPANADKIKCPIHVSGMPIREQLIEAAGKLTKEDSIVRLNAMYGSELSPSVPTILIFGGSQGASELNAALPEALLQLNEQNLQVLHLAGKNKLESTEEAYQDARFKRLLLETSEHMDLFLSAADIVFCRAGGSSMAELSLFGKAAVLIPYPFAADDHQRANGECFVDIDAGIILDNY